MSYHLPEPPRRCPIFTPGGQITRLSSGRQPVIHLSGDARRDILRYATEQRYLESGGGLFSASPSLFDPVTIDVACGPTRSFKHRRSSLRFDPVEVEDSGGGLALAGIWHSHPAGNTRLSGVDLDTLRYLRDAGRPPIRHLVAIVVARDPARGWKAPQLEAWLVGRDSYQAATLRTRPDPPAPTRAHAGDCMLLATRTFTVEIDGQSERIVAGRDRVHSSHPLAQQHPDWFRLETSCPRNRERLAMEIR